MRKLRAEVACFQLTTSIDWSFNQYVLNIYYVLAAATKLDEKPCPHGTCKRVRAEPPEDQHCGLGAYSRADTVQNF